MKQIFKLSIVICLISLFGACKKDDPQLPDNQVNFEATTQGLSTDSTSATIKLTLSRTSTADIPVTIDLITSGITYGTQFTTTPAVTNSALTVTIPAGSTGTTFQVNKTTGIFLSGSESVTFVLSSVTSPAVKGATDTLTLKFGSIVSEGSQLQLEGKTSVSNYANSVFVDLSNNSQTDVDRKIWNLGFYSGSTFRVILNPGYQSTAAALATSDIGSVTVADTANVLNLNHDISDVATAALVDSWSGNLDSTVFAEISATESDNKVYLLSFEGAKTPKSNWYKVKVNRSGEGYKVEYAKIDETTIRTLTIPKDTAYNFSYASLETDKVVSFEPAKASWDIEWSYSTYNSGLGSPYWFQDFVLLNYEGGAQAAQVLTTTVSYENFAESDVSSVTFSSSRDAIGSKWRSTTGSGIYRDRFYIVKDPAGNIYKLQFVSMGVGSDGGERGRPVIEYKLVKKA